MRYLEAKSAISKFCQNWHYGGNRFSLVLSSNIQRRREAKTAVGGLFFLLKTGVRSKGCNLHDHLLPSEKQSLQNPHWPIRDPIWPCDCQPSFFFVDTTLWRTVICIVFIVLLLSKLNYILIVATIIYPVKWIAQRK